MSTQANNSARLIAELRHLKKSFGSKTVLKDVNLEVNKGENLVVMGRSGTGKSVLIKCMVSLIDYDEGHIQIFGKSVDDLSKRELNNIRKKIGFLFQGGALYDSMTVRENLEFPVRRHLRDKSDKEIEEMVHEALENVGLKEAINKMPAELSGGMRKRVSLARTLIMKPELILYDEPTTGLDIITSREISELIVDIQEKYKTTAVIITHDLECARISGNRIAILEGGTVIADGTFEELENSGDKKIRAFFKHSNEEETKE